MYDQPRPCPSCRGSTRNRHERPVEVSEQVWRGYVGADDHCPLCEGTGIERFVITPDGVGHPVKFFPIRLYTGRVIAACHWPGCTKWLDVTNALGMARGQRLILESEGRCANGHRTEVSINKPVGLPEVSKGLERKPQK